MNTHQHDIPLSQDYPSRMMALFSGHGGAHGTHGEPTRELGSLKWGIKPTAKTVHEPVTLGLWEQHLSGRRVLGIIPIDENGECRWGCIDIDEYDADVLAIVERAELARLPLVPCRSKSGGLHLFLFLKKTHPAGAVIPVLRDMAMRIGLKESTEIFPKQHLLIGDKVGNWLAMPYVGCSGPPGAGTFDGKIREQYGLKKTGAEMTLAEFLSAAETASLEALPPPSSRHARRAPRATAQDTPAEAGASYAADMLVKYADELRGTAEGGRNDALNKRAFHMGTMAARGWIAREQVELRLGRAAEEAGLPAAEVRDVLRHSLDDGARQPHADLESDGRPPVHSDEALALRFAERHEADLRFVAAWGRWMSWDGQRWRADDTLRARDLSRHICREAAGESSKKFKASIASAKTVAAVERLAMADRRIAATAEQWDADLWLLNTPGGIVDLRTGATRPADPAAYMSKITGAAPGGDCPMWLGFLRRITGEHEELQLFIKRMLGYALTGETREHALFFCYGTGANGKSVLMSTVAGVLGDYHRAAPIESFTASTMDRHPTDLAGLRGARLVTAVETEEGRRWAESRIKQLTGGDPIAARFMRQDFFEFVPQFKYLVC
jgi:D5 N terminal like